jgi:HTH-type transcriptional regulator/antitoxin HigA
MMPLMCKQFKELNMNIKPIKTEQDYRATLIQIESLMMAKANTPEGDALDVLVTLVEAYERQYYALPLPDPIEAVKFEMERRGLTAKDLVPMIGKPNRVSEVLNRKRGLSLAMIQRLHTMLGIPAESLISSRY